MAGGFSAGSISAKLTLDLSGLEKQLNDAARKVGQFAGQVDTALGRAGKGKGLETTLSSLTGGQVIGGLKNFANEFTKSMDNAGVSKDRLKQNLEIFTGTLKKVEGQFSSGALNIYKWEAAIARAGQALTPFKEAFSKLHQEFSKGDGPVKYFSVIVGGVRAMGSLLRSASKGTLSLSKNWEGISQKIKKAAHELRVFSSKRLRAMVKRQKDGKSSGIMGGIGEALGSMSKTGAAGLQKLAGGMGKVGAMAGTLSKFLGPVGIAFGAIAKVGSVLTSVLNVGIRLGFKALLAPIAAVNFAIGAFKAALITFLAARLGDELFGMANDFQAVGQGFDSVMAGIGGTGPQALGILDRALKGTVDQLETMKTANNAVFLRVIKNVEQFDTLAVAARRLGRAVGRDALDAFGDLSIGIGRQSRLILDNLGLIVNVGKANAKYAAQLNKSVDALTDAEKRQGFYNETMDAVRKKLKLLGPDIETNKDKWGRLNATFKNLSLNLLHAVNERITPALDAISEKVREIGPKIIRVFSAITETMVHWAGRLLEIAGDLGFDKVFEEGLGAVKWGKITTTVFIALKEAVLAGIRILVGIAPQVLAILMTMLMWIWSELQAAVWNLLTFGISGMASKAITKLRADMYTAVIDAQFSALGHKVATDVADGFNEAAKNSTMWAGVKQIGEDLLGAGKREQLRASIDDVVTDTDQTAIKGAVMLPALNIAIDAIIEKFGVLDERMTDVTRVKQQAQMAGAMEQIYRSTLPYFDRIEKGFNGLEDVVDRYYKTINDKRMKEGAEPLFDPRMVKGTQRRGSGDDKDSYRLFSWMKDFDGPLKEMRKFYAAIEDGSEEVNVKTLIQFRDMFTQINKRFAQSTREWDKVKKSLKFSPDTEGADEVEIYLREFSDMLVSSYAFAGERITNAVAGLPGMDPDTFQKMISDLAQKTKDLQIKTLKSKLATDKEGAQEVLNTLVDAGVVGAGDQQKIQEILSDTEVNRLKTAQEMLGITIDTYKKMRDGATTVQKQVVQEKVSLALKEAGIVANVKTEKGMIKFMLAQDRAIRAQQGNLTAVEKIEQIYRNTGEFISMDYLSALEKITAEIENQDAAGKFATDDSSTSIEKRQAAFLKLMTGEAGKWQGKLRGTRIETIGIKEETKHLLDPLGAVASKYGDIDKAGKGFNAMLSKLRVKIDGMNTGNARTELEKLFEILKRLAFGMGQAADVQKESLFERAVAESVKTVRVATDAAKAAAIASTTALTRPLDEVFFTVEKRRQKILKEIEEEFRGSIKKTDGQPLTKAESATLKEAQDKATAGLGSFSKELQDQKLSAALLDYTKQVERGRDVTLDFKDSLTAIASVAGVGLLDKLKSMGFNFNSIAEAAQSSSEKVRDLVKQFDILTARKIDDEIKKIKNEARDFSRAMSREIDEMTPGRRGGDFARIRYEAEDSAQRQEDMTSDLATQVMTGEVMLGSETHKKQLQAIEEVGRASEQKQKDLLDAANAAIGVEFVNNVSGSLFEGLSEGFKAGESLSESFAKAFENAWTASWDSMVKDSVETLQDEIAALFKDDSGLFGFMGGLGTGLLGIGGAILNSIDKSKEATIEDFDTAVNSSEAVRGVVAGPTNIAISRVGDQLKSALGTTEILLERIAVGIESGGGGFNLGGGGGMSDVTNLTTSSPS